MILMRILIYGAGVIGSLYAALFAEAGYDTNIYARGKRLEALRNNGLQYKKNQEVIKAEIRILGELPNDDIYDFVLLTVRENQLYEALTELKNNKSNTIVTMINSLDSYNKWEDIVGKGRILPAFPGAGGSINDDGILDAALTPRLIQPTTFAEISGNKSERTKQFSEILRHAHIPYQKVTDMHLWQLCHLAMVVPIADAYYESDDPEKVEKEWKIMRKTAERLKRNFNFLRKQKGKLSPWKMNIFRFLPLPFLAIMLAVTFGSSFGDKFMYQHAMKAPDEMRELHKQFYVLYEKNEEMRMQGEKDTVIGEKSMKNEEYKKLSIKEFTKAAGRYESSHAGIYEMCKKDYPDPQAFFDSVKRCLRPNGRLVLRDVNSDNKVLVWLMNTLEMPLANICGHGDVQVPTRDVVIKCCKKAGLKVEKFEIRKGMRMHCVVRKPMGKAIGNER